MKIQLGMVENRFADIIWEHAPLSTKQLVNLCEKELSWKRTTTYTVLKKLCDRGIFDTNDSMVTVKISRDEFQAIQSEEFVQETFQGSLPAFVAAFTTRRMPSVKELEELKKLIDSIGGGAL